MGWLTDAVMAAAWAAVAVVVCGVLVVRRRQVRDGAADRVVSVAAAVGCVAVLALVVVDAAA